MYKDIICNNISIKGAWTYIGAEMLLKLNCYQFQLDCYKLKILIVITNKMIFKYIEKRK